MTAAQSSTGTVSEASQIFTMDDYFMWVSHESTLRQSPKGPIAMLSATLE